MKMRVGVLGGSFDPPHNGHVRLGKIMAENMSLDKIYVIPAFDPPHKRSGGLAPSGDRLAMCRLAFTDSVFEVSDTEITRQGKSYTVDTLDHVQSKEPDAEIFLLVGSDMLLYFDKWYKYKAILRRYTVCAFSREADENYEAMKKYADGMLKDGNVILFDLPPLEISSTGIRNEIKRGGNISDFVPAVVENYIIERKLYL